jgi:hypothetical protein
MEEETKSFRRGLPDHLVQDILNMADLDIDTRRALGLKPKRLDEAKAWRLWYLLKSHDGVVYNMETETLHILRIPGCHIVRTPIHLSYHTAGITIFNDEEEEHVVEYTCPCGCFCATTRNDRWATEFRVLMKGARPSRELTVEDALKVLSQ